MDNVIVLELIKSNYFLKVMLLEKFYYDLELTSRIWIESYLEIYFET